MTPSISLGKIAGVKVGINYSLLFVAALIVLNLTSILPNDSPGFDDNVYLSWAIIGAILFFLSILWHELAHAVMARAFGIGVKQIVLNLLGGVAEMESEPKRATQEFWIALIGPLSSAILGGMFLGARQFFNDASVISAVFYWLGTINLLLAGFNMLPGFPLDGGRVLRAVMWWGTGSHLSASRIASYMGQFIGAVLILGGGFIIIIGDLTGLWLAFMGIFFYNASRAQLWFAQSRAQLAGIAIGDIVRNSNTIPISPDWQVTYAMDVAAIGGGRTAAPVIEDGQMIGVFPIEHIRSMPYERRYRLRVREVMMPMHGVQPVDARLDLFEALQEGEIDQKPYLLVLENHRPIGLISQRDILNYRDRMAAQ